MGNRLVFSGRGTAILRAHFGCGLTARKPVARGREQTLQPGVGFQARGCCMKKPAGNQSARRPTGGRCCSLAPRGPFILKDSGHRGTSSSGLRWTLPFPLQPLVEVLPAEPQLSVLETERGHPGPRSGLARDQECLAGKQGAQDPGDMAKGSSPHSTTSPQNCPGAAGPGTPLTTKPRK